MSKALVSGRTFTVTSILPFEKLAFIAKYSPSSLTLFEGEGENKVPVFEISVSDTKSSISKYGACFVKGVDGSAVVEVPVDDITDVKPQLADKYGVALEKLNTLESALVAEYDSIVAKRQAVIDSIEVAGQN